MEMCIDEAGNDDFSGNIDFMPTLVVSTGANDSITANSNVRSNKFPGDKIEKRPPFRTISAGSWPVP